MDLRPTLDLYIERTYSSHEILGGTFDAELAVRPGTALRDADEVWPSRLEAAGLLTLTYRDFQTARPKIWPLSGGMRRTPSKQSMASKS
jgi:hypothetical protein